MGGDDQNVRNHMIVLPKKCRSHRPEQHRISPRIEYEPDNRPQSRFGGSIFLPIFGYSGSYRAELTLSGNQLSHIIPQNVRYFEIPFGISIPDLDLLTIGLVMDIWTEKGNDGTTYAVLATQEDMDAL